MKWAKEAASGPLNCWPLGPLLWPFASASSPLYANRVNILFYKSKDLHYESEPQPHLSLIKIGKKNPLETTTVSRASWENWQKSNEMVSFSNEMILTGSLTGNKQLLIFKKKLKHILERPFFLVTNINLRVKVRRRSRKSFFCPYIRLSFDFWSRVKKSNIFSRHTFWWVLNWIRLSNQLN